MIFQVGGPEPLFLPPLDPHLGSIGEISLLKVKDKEALSNVAYLLI